MTDALLQALPFARRLQLLLRLRARAAVRLGDILAAQAHIAATLPATREPAYV